MRRFILLLAVAVAPALAPATEPSGNEETGFRSEPLAEGLDHPSSLAFLPDGTMLVSLRRGQLLRLGPGGERLSIEGMPPVYFRSQAGFFEVLPAPDFADSGWLYLSYAHGDDAANTTRLARARLQDNRLLDLEVLFSAEPMRNTPVHYGGRMAWLPDGSLILTLGDAFSLRERAQSLEDHLGSIVRLQPDGSAPADNPFRNRRGAQPEIYSYGHRNVQGVAHDAEHDLLLAHEHGPRGGDELNRILPGENYGWPVASHGVDYSGSRISPFTERPGMRSPLLVWTPSIAPSGLALYDGDAFPHWRGDLFVTTLAEPGIRRLRREATRVVGQTRLLSSEATRFRDVRVGPDGALYLLTDGDSARLLRLVPEQPTEDGRRLRPLD